MKQFVSKLLAVIITLQMVMPYTLVSANAPLASDDSSSPVSCHDTSTADETKDRSCCLDPANCDCASGCGPTAAFIVDAQVGRSQALIRVGDSLIVRLTPGVRARPYHPPRP